MREVFINRIKNDVNGNPRYAIDLNYYPECVDLGKAKRNANWIRVFSSYNVEKTLQDCFDEKIQVNIIRGLE